MIYHQNMNHCFSFNFTRARFPLNPTITPISLPKSSSTPSTNANPGKIPDWQLEDNENTERCKEAEIIDDGNKDTVSNEIMNGLHSTNELTNKNEAPEHDSVEFIQSPASAEAQDMIRSQSILQINSNS